MIVLDLSIQFGQFTNTYFGGSNDHWIWKFVPLLGSILSVAVAYFIFSQGQRSAKRKEAARLKNVREYFYVNLLKLKLGVNVQKLEFEKVIEQLKNDRINKISIFRPSALNFEISPEQLLNISKGDTFDFFVRKENIKKKGYRIRVYSSFYTHLELLQKLVFQFEELHKSSIKKYERNQKFIEDNKKKLEDKIKEATQQYHLDGGHIVVSDSYYGPMISALGTFLQSPNGTFDPIMENFIFPVRDVAINNYKHKDSLEIIDFCRTAEYYYEKNFEDKRIYIDNYEHWKETLVNLEKVISKMIKLEFQDFTYDVEVFKLEEESYN